jgi:hypothetical protein
MYCVKFYDPLRGKFGLLKEGDEENEGFRSGRGQKPLFPLLFRIFVFAARINTAGEVPQHPPSRGFGVAVNGAATTFMRRLPIKAATLVKRDG